MADYVPRSQFIPFHNRPQRWACLVTHRRAGKTVSLVNDVALAARTPLFDESLNRRLDPQYAYVGPTYKQAKRIAWAYLKRFTQKYWIKPPSESELKVTLKGNATVYCLGADNADSLRGMYLDGVVMDEYALWKPSVFSQVIRPALSDRNGWGVFSSTPRGKNLFHNVYKAALRDPERYFLLLMRASSSGILPRAELIDLMDHMDAEEYAQEYECSFDAALKGAIYAQEVNDLVASGRIRTTSLYDPNLDTHFVYDLGFTDAMVRIAFQIPPLTRQVHIVSATGITGKDIFWHIDDLHSFGGPIGEVWLPHDARAKNLQTGKSIIEQFIEHGITPRIVPHHNVKDGISTARRLFARVVLDCTPLSPIEDPLGDTVTMDLLEAMKAYQREWDEDLKMFKDQPLHNWASDWMDAFRYLGMCLPPDFLPAPSHSSDNVLQSARASKVWVPSIGYNLETLHADNLARQHRTMP